MIFLNSSQILCLDDSFYLYIFCLCCGCSPINGAVSHNEPISEFYFGYSFDYYDDYILEYFKYYF